MAGELLVDAPQVELRGVLFGDRQTSWIGATGIGGLLIPGVKTYDMDLTHANGAVGGADRLAVRTITVPLVIDASKLASTLAAWAPSSLDIEMHMLLPLFGHVYVTGRPRGLAEGVGTLMNHTMSLLGTFVALDPTIHEVP